MKAVILAGGYGTRMADEAISRPKPLVEIGGFPILWHIMKLYSAHGIDDFVICLGYRGQQIKEFFANYRLHTADLRLDLRLGQVSLLHNRAEPWRITLVDTGLETQVGGRIKRIIPYLEGDPTFCLTYGDGLGDVDITGAIAFHAAHGRLATVTAVQPPGRFGVLSLNDACAVEAFIEKPPAGGQWINGGFFVLSSQVAGYIAGDQTVWEREPMETLANTGQLMAWKHHGFWRAMDTSRDRQDLEAIWATGNAPWKVWK